jgi:hypothetical protein
MDPISVNASFDFLKQININEEIEYPISKDTKSKKLNLLRLLILESIIESIKDFLKKIFIFSKMISIIKMIWDGLH